MKTVRLIESAPITVTYTEETLAEAAKTGKTVLKCRIEAIHETITKNNILYSGDKLKGDPACVRDGKISPSGQHSWTRPYNKPMLANHDTYSDPLGRILEAQYVDKTSIGLPGIEVVAEISDEKTIEMISDGRYLTVSIGADTDSIYCNICGTNIMQDYCGHWKGQTYDIEGEQVKCYWKAGNLWFQELSFVNVPADENARVINQGKPETKESHDIYIIDEENQTLRLLVESVQSEEESKMPEEDKVADVEETVVKEDSAENIVKEDTEGTVTVETETLLEKLIKLVNEFDINKENSESAKLTSAEDSTMQEKVNSLETEINRLNEQVTQLTEINLNLQASIRKDLIEKIVDKKISLGRIAEDKRDEEIGVYNSRSEESLRDTLSDLLKEKETLPEQTAAREVSLVENPGLADVPQKGTITVESKDKEKEIKNPTEVEVISNLIRGTYKRR